MNVADKAVAIAVTMFLKSACMPAASAFFDAGSVKNESDVIGIKATATPKHNIIFGMIILCIEAVVFNDVIDISDPPIIRSPIIVKTLFSTYLETSPTIIRPAKHAIALGNIAKPDADGL